MDDIKDIKRTDQLSRFLESRIIRTSPFGDNVSGEKAYRRAERIVAGLHLLTNHVPEAESVRRSVRKMSIQLLSDILAFRDEMRVSVSKKTRAGQASIRELISLTRILAVAGFISVQNADIMTEALDELGNFLWVSQRSALSESVSFSRDSLLGTTMSGYRVPVSTRPGRALAHASHRDPAISDIRDRRSIKDNDIVVPPEVLNPDSVDARTQGILDILKAGGELGIRDIASNLPEYSEKMIQRELASLVAKRKVNKVGSKRWSRYSLV